MPELAGLPLFSDGNLVSYYKLENVSDSKGSNTLTNNGTVTFAAAKFNNGADLGASNTTKYLSQAGTISIDGGACTFAGWIKAQTEIASGLYYICHQANNTSSTQYILRYEYNSGTRRLLFDRTKNGTADDLFTYNITLGTTDFYHVALTYDGSTVRGYVNGAEIGSVASSGNGSGSATQGFTLGSDTDGNNKASVIIDDFAVFSRAITPTEVLSLYTTSTTIDASHFYFM